MTSRALQNILQGVMSGATSSLRDRRLRREDERKYQKQKSRKREALEMADQFAQKRESRRRKQRIADEQQRYDRKQSRIQKRREEILDQISKLYPERWQDPAFQKRVTSEAMGIKIPSLPANKDIAKLAQEGKIEDAMMMALQSNNPEDRKFYKEVMQAMTARQKLDRLMNPGKYQIGTTSRPDEPFIQSALGEGQRNASDLLSSFIPGADQSAPTSLISAINQAKGTEKKGTKADKKENIRLVEKMLEAKRDEIALIAEQMNNPFTDESQLPALKDAYQRRMRELNQIQQKYLDIAGGGEVTPVKDNNENFKKINDILDVALKDLTGKR